MAEDFTLKPCPFCGKTPDFFKSVLEETHSQCNGKKQTVTLRRYVIRCNHCGAMGAPTTPVKDYSNSDEEYPMLQKTFPTRAQLHELISNWNNRVSE